MAGNENSGRKQDKLFGDAIRLAVKRVDDDDKTELAEIAEKVVEEAKQGNMQAVNIIADRLDGKAAQAILHQGDPENPIEGNWTVEFVNATPEGK
jgi:hypothetical protein